MSDDVPTDDADTAHPDLPLATDEKANRRIRDLAKREAAENRQFWEAVMALKVGRRVMWELLVATGAFEDRFSYGPVGVPDVEHTAFQAGQKAIGLRYFKTWLRDARAGTLTMLDEFDAAVAKPKD